MYFCINCIFDIKMSRVFRGIFCSCIGNKNKPPAMQVCSQKALASRKKPPCYNEFKVRQPNSLQ